jgi:hypothetical protein
VKCAREIINLGKKSVVAGFQVGDKVFEIASPSEQTSLKVLVNSFWNDIEKAEIIQLLGYYNTEENNSHNE